MTSKADLEAAFKLFDKSGDGKLTKEELAAILSRPIPGKGITMTEDEIEELISKFDTNNDGELSIDEFAEAWSKDDGETFYANSTVNNALYDRRFNENKVQIKRLFLLLDVDKSGFIEVSELERVARLYEGRPFDKDEYLKWYDQNAQSKGGEHDGKFDLKEFGWYVSDCAGCEADKMQATIEGFEVAIKAVKHMVDPDKVKKEEEEAAKKEAEEAEAA